MVCVLRSENDAVFFLIAEIFIPLKLFQNDCKRLKNFNKSFLKDIRLYKKLNIHEKRSGKFSHGPATNEIQQRVLYILQFFFAGGTKTEKFFIYFLFVSPM